MLSAISKYTRWLHTQWPAGTIEKGPEVAPDGSVKLPGTRVVGDLTGVPLLKFSADSGAKAIAAFRKESNFRPGDNDFQYDVAIVGAGVSGIAAAIAAKDAGLRYILLEGAQPFSTIKNFPKGKPIYAYPTDMTPEGGLRFEAKVKEKLIAELEEQKTAKGIESTQATVERLSHDGKAVLVHLKDQPDLRVQRAVVAIGKTGNYRRLEVSGEELPKVSNRLIDPKEFAAKKVLVVGGGDSALEAAISLAESGAQTTLSYRKDNFTRPKPENAERLQELANEGKLQILYSSQVTSITEKSVQLKTKSGPVELDNDFVFALTGREAPLAFFRRSGIPISQEFNSKIWLGMAAMLLAFTLFYHWQKGIWFQNLSPSGLSYWVSSLGGLFAAATETPTNLLHHLRNALNQPGFYYSAAYSICVVAFGIRRVKRRQTPYVKWQTFSLACFQVIPLFLLPWLVLPWTGAHGWWTSGGIGQWIGDQFWPNAEYWRAFGLILAWPLFVYNWFTAEPLWGWLILGFLQTFVLIPFLVWKWGKGAYCGWICSCGALAETLGDNQRHKMPHGPFWNRLNMVGQVLLAIALIMMLVRIAGWILPDGNVAASALQAMLSGIPILNWKYAVDLWLAGVLGVAFYFHLSGRVWCRFACPLAALMHIYARFSRFRIFAEKSKCISCNVCTSVCHQGIDIMTFASRGAPMQDPECVRCSACVQSCPTGVLTFGRYDSKGQIIKDRLPASLVQMVEEAKRADQAKHDKALAQK